MKSIERYGPQPRDPSPLRRKCRLLQSWYRVEVLGEADCGPWRKGGRKVGSTLLDGNRSGANFLSPAAFAYAREKVAEKESNPDLTLDEYRLFNNMLSSMPMCFNLFADFQTRVRSGSVKAARTLAAMFRESPMATVETVEVEMIPRPTADYIDDKTAFDAAILFRDADGRRGIASIETKYTDKLGGNTASRQGRKHALAEQLGLFTEAGCAWYGEHGFDQVARNLLLTLAYARKHDVPHAVNYVLAPAEDEEAPAAVTSLRSRLAEPYRDRIVWLTLEQAVERGLAVAGGSLAEHLTRFRRRYLDFTQIAPLMPFTQSA